MAKRTFATIWQQIEKLYQSYTEGKIPRHAKIYRDFKSEYAKLQDERIAAFKEYHDDVINKRFEDPKKTIGIDDREFEEFLKLAEKEIG